MTDLSRQGPLPGAARVLVVEDDRVIADAVTRRLRGAGYEVTVRFDGLSAVAAVEEENQTFDVVVLDLGLPGLDGVEVCRRLQARRPVPVLMLTARADEADRVAGLEAGADDYLPKPFSPRELVARVAALLRRVERAATLAAEPQRELLARDLVVDAAARRVLRQGPGGPEEVHLTRTEFDLLWALARRAGDVVDRSTLLVEALRWPSPAAAALAPPAAVRAVDSHVKALRRKIGPGHIRTVAGVGYALESGEPAA